MSQILLTSLSGALTLLVFASFIPQIHHVWLRKEAGRVSLNYLQWNLIHSTETLCVAFFLTINVGEDVPLWWAHLPKIALDWVNLTQLAGVWILFNIWYFLAIYHSPISRVRKAKRIALYILFLNVSLIPLVIDATTELFCPLGDLSCDLLEQWPLMVLLGLHTKLIRPVTLGLLVLSFYEQARQPRVDISITGLKVQALAFFVSSVCWTFRVFMPWKMIGEHVPLESLYANVVIWFEMLGFAVGGDAIFAIGQCVLLRLELRKMHDDASHTAGERQPLLDPPQERVEEV
ncbi:uncharacterized protein N7506_002200 [Penicillium brevicompactum]|uniref:uncharacterized protein n=1 Tax=Penicillium brevicompactum TaxID=5074 RepID=UPI0025418629|nr:uncharacterized protein N7506_002200 [Penicillium brevicompactum]KAJ5348947.1 hypothetical protein N7506_002200 [Penicillium brevicompactum]